MSDNEQKNENRETVADIVAQMRYGTIPKHRTDHELLAIYADRIEASWKREKIEVEADALEVGGIVEATRHRPGNAAAMREALTEIRDTIMNGGFDVRSPAHFVNICDAALSAPDRNCDKYATAEDAYDAYDEITHADIEKYDECRQNCPMCDEKLYIPCEVKWLFAPATERKGEGDGR